VTISVKIISLARLAEQLAGIKVRFLLSLNDTAGVRGVFAGFHFVEAATTYTIGAGASTRAAELIISNVPVG
jgi:DNA adenine methylase